MSDGTERWVVIGGGLAGLLAARRLARAGNDVTLIEAAPRVGGRTSSIEVDGLTVDAAAESFATRGGTVAALARELGLGEDVVNPAPLPAWVVSRERAYALPATGWLGIPTDPHDPQVIAVIGRVAAEYVAQEPTRPLGDLSDRVTVGQLVRERLGDAVARELVAPILQGVYSRDLDELPLGSIDPSLVEQLRATGSLVGLARARRASSPAGSAVQGIVGGVSRLCEAVATQARLAGAHIVTSTRVRSLTRGNDGWHLDGGRVEADRVVLAVPLSVARTLVPDLPADPPRYVTIVTVAVENDALDSAPRGTGVLAVGTVTRAKALTHETAKWPWLAERAQGRHVFRLSYAVDKPGEEVASRALVDASRLFGVDILPEQVRAAVQVTWPDAAPVRVDNREPVEGLHVVGSAAGLSGLAAIVAGDTDFR